MPGAILGLEVSKLGSVLKPCVNEVLHTKLGNKLIQTNAPVDLCFFSNSEAVGICEDVLYALESFSKCGSS